VSSRRGDDGLWPFIDDPENQYPPPSADSAAAGDETQGQKAWPRGSYGLPELLKSYRDIKVLGSATFAKVTTRTLPARVQLAVLATGLSDHLLTADLPLSNAQIDPYLADHPEVTLALTLPSDPSLPQRLQRCYSLYLLSLWENRLGAGKH
jgi:hypothetical protein